MISKNLRRLSGELTLELKKASINNENKKLLIDSREKSIHTLLD